MYCQKCKKQNEEDAIYCEHCGSVIIEDSSSDIIDTRKETVRKKRKKRKFMRDYGLLIIQTMICMGLVIAFVVIGKRVYSIEKYAKNYFESVADGVWGEVYDYLELPDSEYLSKSNFMKSMVEAKGFLYSSYRVETAKEDSNEAIVSIIYVLEDTGEKSVLSLKMRKSKERDFLFFPVWKVDGMDFLALNTKVQIPDGVSLTLNEIPLEGNSVQIPYLFGGSHLLEVRKEDMNGTSEVIQIPVGSDYTHVIDGLSLQESVKTEIFQTAARSFNNIFVAAMNQKDFAHISNLFINDETVNMQLKSEYEAFAKVICNEEGYGIKNLSFKNVNGSLVENEGTETILTVVLEAEYTYSVEVKKEILPVMPMEEGESETETQEQTEVDEEVVPISEIKTGFGSYTTKMEFVKEGENWLLRNYEFNIPVVK
jgi:Predicted membrane protein